MSERLRAGARPARALLSSSESEWPRASEWPLELWVSARAVAVSQVTLSTLRHRLPKHLPRTARTQPPTLAVRKWLSWPMTPLLLAPKQST